MQMLFDELRAEVTRVKPASAATLRPGLPSSAIRTELAKLPYQITPEAASLYQWADGADGQLQLLPGAYFVPWRRAMEEFHIFHGMGEEMDAIFPQQYRDCFRFLTDWSDGGYAFGRVDSPSGGQIVSMCIHEEWRIGFKNLEHLLRTSIMCYRDGIIPAGEDETPDFDRFYELAARLNPGVELWRSGAE
jgi:hypothetical protein